MRLRTKLLAALIAAIAAVVGTAGTASAATNTATRPTAVPLTISAKLKPAGAARAVNPECVLSWIPDSTGKLVNVHISTFLYHRHNIRAAKVNAQIKCRRVSMNVLIRVQLWKTGLIFDHKQADTTAGPKTTNLLKNQGTWRQCSNRTSSTFYGLTSGQVTFQGNVYSAAIRTPKNATLPCGT